MVLTQHGDLLYFLFACADWILVFSEATIVDYPSGKSVNGKKFYYRVYPEDVISIDGSPYDLSLSFLSRNQGQLNEFWTGSYNEERPVNPNINLITIDFDAMSISNVVSYSVDSDFDYTRIQGMARIGDNMLLTQDPEYVSSLGENKLSKLILCPLDSEAREVRGAGCETQCSASTEYAEYRVLQGSEVSEDGTVYVGSAFGSPRGIWYEFGDFDSLDGGDCSSWDSAPPAPQAPLNEPWVLKVAIPTVWLYIACALLLLNVMCLTVCWWNGGRGEVVGKIDSWGEKGEVQ